LEQRIGAAGARKAEREGGARFLYLTSKPAREQPARRATGSGCGQRRPGEDRCYHFILDETADHWAHTGDRATRSGADRGPALGQSSERTDDADGWRGWSCGAETGGATGRTAGCAEGREPGSGRFAQADPARGRHSVAADDGRVLPAAGPGVCPHAVARTRQLAAWTGSSQLLGCGGGGAGVSLPGRELVLAGAAEVGCRGSRGPGTKGLRD
jgi:hypothetical protein